MYLLFLTSWPWRNVAGAHLGSACRLHLSSLSWVDRYRVLDPLLPCLWAPPRFPSCPIGWKGVLHVGSSREPGLSADPTPQDPFCQGWCSPCTLVTYSGCLSAHGGSRGDSLSCGSWEKPFHLGVWPGQERFQFCHFLFSSWCSKSYPRLCMGDLSSALARIPTLSYSWARFLFSSWGRAFLIYLLTFCILSSITSLLHALCWGNH